MSTPVAIIGSGMISALGDDAGALHDALCDGRNGFSANTTLGDPAPTTGGIDFDPRAALPGRNFRPLDRTGRLAAVAAGRALEDSAVDASDCGLVLGTLFGGLHTIVGFDHRVVEAGPAYAKPLDFANSVINAAGGQTAIWHGLPGVNSTVAGGATAGLQALGYAADLIRTGRARTLLAGGAEELSPEAWEAFRVAGLLAGDDEVAAPLSQQSRGLRLAEGAAFLTLQGDVEAERAHGWLRGWGSAFDPQRGEQPESMARALTRAIRAALDDAALETDAIDAVWSGANGTLVGDHAELGAFEAIFGDAPPPTVAVKTRLGEALGAAGAFQSLDVLASFADGRLAGTAWTDDDPTLPESLFATTREQSIDVALLTATGLDGLTCAVVLSREPS
ncbi:MAG: beta-ketoacyl synthase N-terminal-like domain-containing protein [Acidobacteriota bacterium]